MALQINLPTGKSDYNFEEAARILGISARELRTLVIHNLLDEPDAVQNLPRMRFRPADLIMLSMVKTPCEESSSLD
jgi:hypothetical protein